MQKGMDIQEFIKFQVNKKTGEKKAVGRVSMRPPSGTKEIARRRKANKAAKAARRNSR